MGFRREKKHIAAYDYKCDACNETIKTGEDYTNIVGYDDEFYNRKECKSCREKSESRTVKGLNNKN